MLRKLACVGVVLLFCISIATADEFIARITKIEGNKVTLVKGKKGDTQEMTLPASKSVKVVNAKFNPDTKKLEAGDPIENGLKNEMFTKISDKGLRATIVTDTDNKNIVEIRVGGKKKDLAACCKLKGEDETAVVRVVVHIKRELLGGIQPVVVDATPGRVRLDLILAMLHPRPMRFDSIIAVETSPEIVFKGTC